MNRLIFLLNYFIIVKVNSDDKNLHITIQII